MTKDELIHEDVIDGKLKEALNTLKKVVKAPDLLNTVILYISNLKTNDKAILNDTEEVRLIEKRNNKIKLGILEILNKITSLSPSDGTENQIDKLEELLDDLEIINQAFVAQSRLRDQLLASLKRRFTKRRFTHFEKIFSQYYDELTPSELRKHQTIRGYTQNIIHTYNVKVLEALNANPALKDEIPRLKDLQKHIIIWKSKYDSIFVNDKTINLVYVGVEERVPFPRNIETEIKEYINSYQ